MAAATPTAIQPIVPEEIPFAVFLPAASPAWAAPFASVAGFASTPGSAVFFGHVSQGSSATARETDPRLMVRKQAAQRIATTDFAGVPGRVPRMSTLQLKR